MERLFIISGEKSGDLIAKNLIETLKKTYPEIKIKGIGGESFSQNGLTSIFDQKNLAIMGFFEILPKIPKMLKLLRQTKAEIYKFKPNCVITIDSPGFNFRLASSIQKTRLSQNEVYAVFKNYKPEKSATSSLKFVRNLQNIWRFLQNYAFDFFSKYRFLRIFLKILNWVMHYLNNRYTKFAIKFVLKPIHAIIKHTPFKLVIIAIFGRFFAVASILYAIVLYFNAFRFLKWPIIIGHKIYDTLHHKKQARKDLSSFYRAVELRKLQSKNTMICSVLDVVNSLEVALPKWLKFKFITNFANRLNLLYKMFKKNEYQKAFRCKIYHIVAPSVWAYKEKRAEKVATLYNALFCILPFEPPYFEKYGLKTVFIGYYPYFRMQEILPTLKKNDDRKIIISITLGSRLGEIKKHIPVVQNAMKHLEKTFPQAEYNIISLPNFKPLLLKYFFKSNIITDEHEKWQAVYNSNFIIAKSGTNVMECAFLGIPSIVYYKTGVITGFLIKNWAYIKHITLVNITANKEILPEFVQLKTKNIGKKAQEWLENPQKLEEIKTQMNCELEKFKSSQNPSDVIIANI